LLYLCSICLSLSPAQGDQHKDHKILHAVEAAEKAVLHAVEQEVELLFHDLKNEHGETHAEKAGKTAKKGLEKAKKHVEETHEHRRKWLSDDAVRNLEEYIELGLGSLE
jgi:hypothetical protein